MEMELALSSGASSGSSYNERCDNTSAGGGLCNRRLLTGVSDIVFGSSGSSGNNVQANAEAKENFRSLYLVAKQLDDERKQVKSISDLFQHNIEEKRAQLVQLCKKIIFKDFQSFGKKAREMLWRKGYYEFISFVKKNWSRELRDLHDPRTQEILQKLERFLCAGINNYKRMAARMEEIYDLDLKYLIDFTIIRERTLGLREQQENRAHIGDRAPLQVVDKSLEAISFALDTIHSALLSLGDLHRYFLDFRIDMQLHDNKKLAAKYYFEAFKLNPSFGMSQNQLGTLYYGQNYDLDSIYHYLYSLASIVPFELSENNVGKLFAAHAAYLDNLVPDKIEFSLQDFYARFYLVVDIFFFDKEVPDFNGLCHCVLVDLRKILCSKSINISEPDIFKIVAILFLCLSKLKMINSQKVFSLNAFLVAVCSDLMDACIVNIEQNILIKAQQNEEFHAAYAKQFEEFDVSVRKSRNEFKDWLVTGSGKEGNRLEAKEKKSGKPISLKDFSSDSKDSQRSVDEPNNLLLSNNTGDKHMEPISTRSSDEAKESDLKTPLSNKSKRRGMRFRRRRRKLAQSDASSCYDDSDSEVCSDSMTEDEYYTDLSSNFDTDFSDIDMDMDVAAVEEQPEKAQSQHEASGSQEELQQVAPHAAAEYKRSPHSNSQEIDSEELLRSFEVLQLHHCQTLNFKNDENESPAAPTNAPKNANCEPPQKAIYRNKYTKIDPNIVVDFVIEEPTVRALRILFDWLRINHDLLFSCYHSNPEFIHKIMKLLNYFNIDIFTRKVYFEREFLHTTDVRQSLLELFDARTNVPLSEDFIFKSFDIFQSVQLTIDWETTLRESVTENEEHILRIFKMVDFGFFICKQKKFNYRFCIKTRKFTENKKKRDEKKCSSRRRERRTVKTASRKRVEGRTRRYSDRKNGIVRKSCTSNEEKDTVEEGKKVPRKGYLRNRNSDNRNIGGNASLGQSNGSLAAGSCTTPTIGGYGEKLASSSGADEERSEAMNKKCEMMGKLWLKNTVHTLAEELRDDVPNGGVVLTPYLIVDAKALTEYNSIVKNLVKSKKFIVLIPNAVFRELDDLKKRSENARNVIRWMEQEFKQGNRNIRTQRENESLNFTLLKIPRKLDRDANNFMQIAQFCNHLVASNSDPNASEYKKNVVTYLSGDVLHEKQRAHANFSYTGILDSIPVRHDQIANYYAKFKLNKK